MTVLVILPVAVVLIALAVLGLLVVVLIGIHDEERHMSLTGAPRTRTGAITRHLVGLGIRTSEADSGENHAPGLPPKGI